MIKLYDVTLRDGNHALRHSLTKEFVKDYCAIAEESGLWAVEVGHGNGLGASSYLVGKSLEDDKNLLCDQYENNIKMGNKITVRIENITLFQITFSICL